MTNVNDPNKASAAACAGHRRRGLSGHQSDPISCSRRGVEVTSLDIEPFTYPERDRSRDRAATSATRRRSSARWRDVDVVVHCAAALPLYTPAGHLHDRRRRHPHRPRVGSRARASSARSTFPRPRSTASPTIIRCWRTTGWTASGRTGRPRSRPRWSRSRSARRGW